MDHEPSLTHSVVPPFQTLSPFMVCIPLSLVIAHIVLTIVFGNMLIHVFFVKTKNLIALSYQILHSTLTLGFTPLVHIGIKVCLQHVSIS